MNEELNNVNLNTPIEPKKKSKKGVVIAVILIIALLLVGGGLFAYKIFVLDKAEPTVEPKKEEKKEIEEVEDDGEKYKVDETKTFTDIDYANIDMSKEFPTAERKLEALKELKENEKLELSIMGINAVDLTLTGNKLKLDFDLIIPNDNQIVSREFDNVEKVYYDFIDCSLGNGVVMVKDGKTYYKDYNTDVKDQTEVNNYFKELKKTYTEYYYAALRGLTCGSEHAFLGKTADGKYYNLANEKEFDIENNKYNFYINDTEYILKDRTFKKDILTGKAKVVFMNSVVDSLDYVIDENDIAYDVQYVDDVHNVDVKKLSDSKVTKVSIDNNDTAVITFADGTQKQLEYVRLVY